MPYGEMEARRRGPGLTWVSEARASRRNRGEAGFGLLELVIAVTLGAVVITGISRALASSLAATRSGRTTVQSSLFAAERLEQIRGIGWGDGLAHTPGSLATAPEVVNGTFDPDGAGPQGAEDIVYNSRGEISSHASQTTRQGISFTVKVFVTNAGTARRVTTIIEWREQDRERSTRFGTLINPVSTTVVGGSPTPGSIGDVNHGRATVGAIDIALPGLLVQGSSLIADVISSSPGAVPTMSGSGSITINGTAYVNPAPNTLVTVGTWRVTLNTQRAEADGSRTVIMLRINDSASTELNVAYAWAKTA